MRSRIITCLFLAIGLSACASDAPDDHAPAADAGYDLEPLWVRVGDSEGAIDQEN